MFWRKVVAHLIKFKFKLFIYMFVHILKIQNVRICLTSVYANNVFFKRYRVLKNNFHFRLLLTWIGDASLLIFRKTTCKKMQGLNVQTKFDLKLYTGWSIENKTDMIRL